MAKSKTINSYFYKNKLWFSILIFADVVQAFAVVGISYFIARVFAAVEEINMESIRKLIPLGIIVLAGYFGSQCFQKYARRKFFIKIDTQMRTDVFWSIVSKDFKDFGEKNTAEYISIMNNEVGKIESDYVSEMPYMLETVILTVISSVGLFFYSIPMAIVIILTALFTIIVPAMLGKHTSEATDSYMNSLAEYNVRIKDIFSGYEVIKSFHAEKRIVKVHEKVLLDMEDRKYKYRAVRHLFSCMVELATYLVIIVQYIVAAYLVTRGSVSLAMAMGALNLGNTVNNQAREATSSLISLKGTKKIRERMDGILNSVQEENDCIDNIEGLGDVFVRGVSFAYNDEKEVLKNIDFVFRKGKKYAIVGGSGSGKTTLIKLIMQYYDNYSGEIYCGDRDIKSIPKKALYSKMAMIHQKVFMFDDTLKNNITMYQNYEENEIADAVRKAGLEDVVRNHPQGLEQSVGENGKNLSGGEQQRVAIARALLKKSDMLILDEATSNLDNEVTVKIENTVLGQKNMTAVVITHKLAENVLKQYDSIVVLHRGEIAEWGTFDELMEKKSKFYGLYMLNN